LLEALFEYYLNYANYLRIIILVSTLHVSRSPSQR